MKITIYELLGMIKDGKAPKKIKVTGTIYYFDEEFNFYFTKSKKGNVALGGKLNEINLLYNFNNEYNVEILEEEKKIPEKLPYYSMEKIQKAKNKDEWREERITLLEKRVEDLHIKMNDLLDYLKSKGDN